MQKNSRNYKQSAKTQKFEGINLISYYLNKVVEFKRYLYKMSLNYTEQLSKFTWASFENT